MPVFSVKRLPTLCSSAGPMRGSYGKGYLHSAKLRYDVMVAQELHARDDEPVADRNEPHISKGHG